jgi:hypothetical protein
MKSYRHDTILRRALLLVGLLGLALPVTGQDTIDPAEPVPMYRVEIIVFENLRRDARPEDPGRPPMPPPVTIADALGDDPLIAGEDLPREAAVEDPGMLTPAEPLFFAPADEFSLAEAWARLRRSSAYRPLLHEAWTQPGVEQSLARPVELATLAQVRRVSAGGAPLAAGSESGTDVLDGEVKLYRSRYLHLSLDLTYTDGNGEVLALTGSRRMRSNEMHFFDAPNLGVIARIEPLEVTAAGTAGP